MTYRIRLASGLEDFAKSTTLWLVVLVTTRAWLLLISRTPHISTTNKEKEISFFITAPLIEWSEHGLTPPNKKLEPD